MGPRGPAFARIRIPRRHAYIYKGDSSTRSSTYAFVSIAHVGTRKVRARASYAGVRARTRLADQSRHRTIFEPGKERSKMNFLHNFGSPRRFSFSLLVRGELQLYALGGFEAQFGCTDINGDFGDNWWNLPYRY